MTKLSRKEKQMRSKSFAPPSSINGGLSSATPLPSFSSEVSTALVLHDESWENSCRTKPATNSSGSSAAESAATVAGNIERMRFSYSEKVEEEERLLGLSTELKLFELPWKIRKKLKSSDVGNLCRLLLQTETVKAHILPHLNEEEVREVEGGGLRFRVMDDDTKSMHHLVLKKWRTSKSYVMMEGWRQGFVKRRRLSEGDEVGIFWDPMNSMVNFTVIKKASPKS